jgi:tRNA G18 (ribose-2'-O)-methylase SpoU
MTAPAIHKVTSLTLPELEPYRTLRRPLDHIRRGIFVAEGEKVVRRLLASDLTVVSILLTPEWHEQIFPNKNQGGTHLYQRVENVPVFVAEKKLLESIVGFNLHQGIMAVAKVPEARPLEEVVSHLKSPHLLVALEGLVSAENVGVVVRNCAAFGVDAIIVGETSSSPYLRRAVRNSMGTVFHIPVVHAEDLAGSLKWLSQKCSTRIVGTVPGGDTALREIELGENLCLVLGNEEAGLSANILKVCDARVAIPMANGVDSLNVASASAVFLYEAASARRNKNRAV